MADPDFKLADFAKHVSILADCMGGVTKEKPTMDRKAARDAIAQLSAMLGPGEAEDTDPALAEQERKLKTSAPTQEVAKDSRYDTRFSVGEIFNGKHSDDMSVGAPSLSEIFGGSKPVLGEG